MTVNTAGITTFGGALGGATALVIATIRGNVDLAKMLLDKGADPNAGPGFTPLHWAAGEWGGGVDTVSNGRRDENSEWKRFEGLEGPAKLELVNALLATRVRV